MPNAGEPRTAGGRCPGGAPGFSPAIHCWDAGPEPQISSPGGTTGGNDTRIWSSKDEALIEFDVVPSKKRNKLLLQRSRSMMFLLPLDILDGFRDGGDG